MSTQAGAYDRWVATNTKYMVTHLLDTSTTTTLEDNSTVLCLQLVPEHLQLLYVTVEWVVLKGSYNRPILTFFFFMRTYWYYGAVGLDFIR